MKLPLWAKWVWWIILVAIVGFVIWKRLDLTAGGESTPFDAVAFVVWVALLLAPIFSEVKIWGVELKQEIKEAKEELTKEIHSVKAEVTNSIHFQPIIGATTFAPPPDSQLPAIREEVERAVNEKLNLFGIREKVESKPLVPDDVTYLFSVRYSIEQEVRRIAAAVLDARTNTQLRKQVEVLAKSGSINSDMARAIIDVYRICSPAVHGDPTSVQQTNFVRDVAPKLLEALRSIPELRPD